MGDTAESAGLVHTADFILGIIETEQLAQQGQQMFKQVKSRYGDKSKWSRFFLAVDKGLQRWSQLDANSFPDDQTMPPAVTVKAPASGSGVAVSIPSGEGIEWD